MSDVDQPGLGLVDAPQAGIEADQAPTPQADEDSNPTAAEDHTLNGNAGLTATADPHEWVRLNMPHIDAALDWAQTPHQIQFIVSNISSALQIAAQSRAEKLQQAQFAAQQQAANPPLPLNRHERRHRIPGR